jgi:ABC-2 type transport system permease protein
VREPAIQRISAIIERDMRKFLRSPALMMSSMIFPLMQLIVLGYAFGGKIKGIKIAVVDEDRTVYSRDLRERFDAIVAGPQTMKVENYNSVSDAIVDLRAGFVRAVVYIPVDYSRRVDQGNRPRIAFIEDNTDNFVTSEVLTRMQDLVKDINQGLNPFQPGQRLTVPLPRLNPLVDLQVVELYPYIEYIKYLLAGSIAMSIFIVAMIGGGITFIDDKSRGLHEGYLVTPITKTELILGLIFSGAIKGLMAGTTITIIGGLIAGIDRLWDPVRLFYLMFVLGTTSVAMISFMFLLMVRVSDPLVPRAMFGVLNTLLYFPSGAIYPVEGFPVWLRWISYIDPFTYAVHALKALLLKNTGFSGIYSDILILSGFSVVLVILSVAFFKRQI